MTEQILPIAKIEALATEAYLKNDHRNPYPVGSAAYQVWQREMDSLQAEYRFSMAAA